MADKKNIVIRVNYPKHGNGSEKPLSTPELITEWNVKRILLAIGVLSLLCVVFFLVINHEDQNYTDINPGAPTDAAPKIRKDEDSAVADLKPVPKQAEPLSESKPVVNSITKSDKPNNNAEGINATETVSKPVMIKNKESINYHQSPINVNQVSRALLTTGINNKEPIDEFTPPVKIGHKQTVILYYFTELKKLKDRALYHEWLRDGQVVAKRQLYIGDERWRTSSKMTFSDKSKGNWIVRLVDKSGQILNQKSFSVALDE